MLVVYLNRLLGLWLAIIRVACIKSSEYKFALEDYLLSAGCRGL